MITNEGDRYDLEYWEYDWWPPIKYHTEGEDIGWSGGPVHATGWYIDPYCDSSCCRPKGPFSTYHQALRYSRITRFHLSLEVPGAPTGSA